MGNEQQVIRVTSEWEEHSIVLKERCDCGQGFSIQSTKLEPGGPPLIECFLLACCGCGAERALRFDVSDLLEPSKAVDPIAKAWPPPQDGEYRVDLRAHHLAAREIQQKFERGEISAEIADQLAKASLDRTHPSIAGRYQVFGQRAGSMGRLYLCVDTQWKPGGPLDYFVVCKMVESFEPTLIESLRQEANVWLELPVHDGIVHLREIVRQSKDRLILVMEAVLPGPEGRTNLEEWIEGDSVPVALAVLFLRDVCSALMACKGAAPGFVHGDLKPSNLLVGVGYRIKLSDLGLSVSDAYPGSATRLVGTPLYRAPELWDSRARPTESSDIYALGLIFYECVLGAHPFAAARDLGALEDMHCHRSVGALPETVPAEVAIVMARCLEKDPRVRPTLTELVRVV